MMPAFAFLRFALHDAFLPRTLGVPCCDESALAMLLHTFFCFGASPTCRLVIPDLLWRNRGFVLDGWPRTANAARCAFMQQAPLDEEDQAELAAEV
eukprot:scaffold1631_cov19-Tisochrysis_lutea.AAC.1